MQEIEDLQVRLNATKSDNLSVTELLEKVQKDKKMLSNRIHTLSSRGNTVISFLLTMLAYILYIHFSKLMQYMCLYNAILIIFIL